MPKDTLYPFLEGAAGGKGGGSPSEAANTLQSNQTVRMVDILCEGPIEEIEQVYFNETPTYEDFANRTDPNFEGITITERLGTADQTYITGFADQEAETLVDTQVVQATPIQRTITNADTDACRVVVKLPALFQYDDDGDINPASVRYRVQYRPDGGSWIDIPGSAVIIEDEKNTSPVYIAHRFQLTGAAPWDVQVVRITDDSEDNTKLQNDTVFFAISEIIEQKINYRHSAYLGILADAQQFGQRLPTRAALGKWKLVEVPSNYDGVARTYSGVWNGTWVEAWTDDPVWIFRDMVVNKRYGLGEFVSEAFLDSTTLYTLSQYCAEQVDDGDGGTEPRFSFNGVIQSAQEAYDLLNAMASVFRGMVYWSFGMVTVAQDKPTDAILNVARANTINGEFSYSGASIRAVHNRVNVTYNDPNNFYKREVVSVDDPDHIRRYGLRETDIIAFGCTSRAQAVRAARWLLYTERLESEVCTYVGGQDHVDIAPGNVVRLHDPVKSGTSLGGRLVSYTTNTVTLDREVTLESGKTYELCIHDRDRDMHYRTVTSAPGAHTTLTLSVNLPTSPGLTEEPRDTVWVLREDDGTNETLYRVLGMREVGHHQYEVSAVQHVPTKYDTIEGGYDIPDYPEALLPTGALPVPLNLRAVEQVKGQSGTLKRVELLVSLTRAPDVRIRGIELEYRRKGDPWRTYDMRLDTSWTLENPIAGDKYQFRARSYDALGSRSAYTPIFTITPRTNPLGDAIAQPTSPNLVGGYKIINALWTNPTIPNFKGVQVWHHDVDIPDLANVAGTATLDGVTPGEVYQITNLEHSEERYVWLRTVIHDEGDTETYSDFLALGSTLAEEPDPLSPENIESVALYINQQYLADIIADIDTNATTIASEVSDSLSQHLDLNSEIVRVETEYEADLASAVATINQDFVAIANVDSALALSRYELSASLGINNLIITPYPQTNAADPTVGWTNFTEVANVPSGTVAGATSFQVGDTFSYEEPAMNGDFDGVQLQLTLEHDLTSAPSNVQVVLVDEGDNVKGNKTIITSAGWATSTVTFDAISGTTQNLRIGIRCIGAAETADLRNLRLVDVLNEANVVAEIERIDLAVTDAEEALATTSEVLRASFDPESFIFTKEPLVTETDEDGDWTNMTVLDERPSGFASWRKVFQFGSTAAQELPYRYANLNGRTMNFRALVDTGGAADGARLEIKAVLQGAASETTVTTVGTVTIPYDGGGYVQVDEEIEFTQDTVRWYPQLRCDTGGQTAKVTEMYLDAVSGFKAAEALVVAEAAARASDIAAEATLRQGVQTNLDDFEATAYATFRTASQVNSQIASFNLDLNADFTSVRGDISDIEDDVSDIQSNYVTTATLTANYYTEAAADTAIAQAITDIEVSFEGSNVSLQTISSALDGVRAEHGVVINNNGVVSGTKLISDIVDGGGVQSNFIVQANKFTVVTNSNTTGSGQKQPFEISGSYVKLTGDVIIDGSLTVVSDLNKSSFDTATENQLDNADANATQALSDASDAQTDATQALTNAANAQADVDAKPDTYRQSTAPSSPKAGDIWIDTTNNKVKRYSGSSWQAATIEAESVVAGWIYAGDIVATQITTGVLNANRINLNGTFLSVNGSGELEITNDAIDVTQLANDVVTDIQTGVNDSAQALTDAAAAQGDATQAISDASDAQATADSKNECFFQYSAPTANAVGDIWFDTSGGAGAHKVRRWSGSSWVEVTLEVEGVVSDWVYTGTLTAAQVNAVAINAGSITAGVLSATVLNLNGTMFTANGDSLEIADDAIDTAQIANDAIENAQIATDAVTGDSILANSVDTVHIAADAITATEIDVSQISAISADLGTITGGSLDIGSASQGLEVNVSGKENAVYANQNHLHNYALYAENHFDNNSFASGAMYIQSHNGYTLQIIQTDDVTNNVAASIQNSASGGGNVELGCANLTGGYGVEVISGGYYDTSGDGYAPFTGKHEAYLRAALEAQIEPGDIVCDRIVVARKGVSDAITVVRPCTKVADKTAVGVYASTRPDTVIPAALVERDNMDGKAGNDFTEEEVDRLRQPTDRTMLNNRRANAKLIYMNSLGEGLINVCGRNGDFEAGDLVVTSDLRGKGQKQDDDLIRNYTVAKVREPVTFDHPDEVKTVACIYMCG